MKIVGIEGATHTKDLWCTPCTVKYTLDRRQPESELVEKKERKKQVKSLKMLGFKDQRKTSGELCDKIDTAEGGHAGRTTAKTWC